MKYLQYNYIIAYSENYPYGQGRDRNYLFIVQPSNPFTERVAKEEIYSITKFLVDVGNSLRQSFVAGLSTVHGYVLFSKSFVHGVTCSCLAFSHL